ncbi:unnamed protein product [Camellia sinensis]
MMKTGELRYVQMVVTTYNTSLPYAERYRNGKVEQLHKIFKLCGSPSEEYWRKSKLPHATIFKPQQPYRRCVVDTFKDFPAQALELMETLLSIDPADRGSEASALHSESLLDTVSNWLSDCTFLGPHVFLSPKSRLTCINFTILTITTLCPAFDSQTKETLTIRQSSFGSKCELSQEFLKKVCPSLEVESLLSWADFKIYVQMQAAKRSQTPLPSQVNDDRIILDKTLTDQVSIWKSSRGLTDKVVLDHDCSGETCTYYQIGDVFVCEKTGQVHVCDDTCREAVLDPTNELFVCTISGHCFDRLLSPAEMEPDTVDSVVYLVDAYDKETFAEVDSVVYLVDAYDKETFAEAKKGLDALHKKQQ